MDKQEDERPSEESSPRELVTITTAVTPVIVKAISTNSHDIKIQRPSSESVLVIAQNPQVKTKSSPNKPHQVQYITGQAVIVKNTNALIVHNYNRNINSSQSVIKSTKCEQWKLAHSSTSTSFCNSIIDGDISNDSCSILTTASDNSIDSVTTPVGSAHGNDKTDEWREPPQLDDDNDDSRDSKTDDFMSTPAETSKPNARCARNRAEKQRRDRLNKSIKQLSALVPLVKESPKKVDKTGVLRLTAHHLRVHHVFGNAETSNFQNFNPKLINYLIEKMEGVLFAATYKGIIVEISPNVEEYLGHNQIDLLGTNILNLCHPQDIEVMKTNLMPHHVPLGLRGELLPNKLSDKEFTDVEEIRCFHVRLARAVPRSEVLSYEVCWMRGSLRRSDKAHSSLSPPVRRQRQRHDDSLSISGNDVVFIGMFRLRKNMIVDRTLLWENYHEYRTRHLIDGRIVSCDQRVSVIAGYLTSELTGVSAISFMHRNDVRWVMIALRRMYDLNIRQGESSYRLLTRSGNFIYLRTSGYLEMEDDNTIKYIVCVNRKVSEQEGKTLIMQMRRQYSVSPIVDNMIEDRNPENVDDIEEPRKLEKAIRNLITNLLTTMQIEAPEVETIKSTIDKSLSLIGKTCDWDHENIEETDCSQSPTTLPLTQDISGELSSGCIDAIDKMDLFRVSESPIDSPAEILAAADIDLDTLSGTSDLYKQIIHDSTSSTDSYNFNDINIDEMRVLLAPSTSNSNVNKHPQRCYIFNPDEPSTSRSVFEEQSPDVYFAPFSLSSQNVVPGAISTDSSVQPVDLVGTVNSVIGSSSVFHQGMSNSNRMLVGQKRPLPNEEPVGHKRINVEVDDDVQLIEQNPNVANERLDNFIGELTNPNSDLGDVVPRSLVALESSITDLDDTVTHINPVYSTEENNYSNIMTTHSENKYILEGIINEHQTSTNEGKPVIKGKEL